MAKVGICYILECFFCCWCLAMYDDRMFSINFQYYIFVFDSLFLYNEYEMQKPLWIPLIIMFFDFSLLLFLSLWVVIICTVVHCCNLFDFIDTTRGLGSLSEKLCKDCKILLKLKLNRQTDR